MTIMTEPEESMALAAGTKRSAPEEDSPDEHDEQEGGNKKRTISPVDPNLSGAQAAASEGEAESREERLAKNRQKARDRRNRKKALIEDMQRNVVVLSRMNADLRAKNQDLIKQLAQYGAAGHPGSLEGIETTDTTLLSGMPSAVSMPHTVDASSSSNALASPAGSAAAAPTSVPAVPGITDDAAAVAQQAVNQQARVLAGLNPSMLAGNPALLQLLNQQVQIQNLQAQQQASAGFQQQAQQAPGPAPVDAAVTSGLAAANPQATQLQAHLMALQNLQAAAGMQQSAGMPQLALMGGLNPAALAGVQGVQQAGAVGMAAPAPAVTGAAAVGTTPSPGIVPGAPAAAVASGGNPSAEPSRPVHIVVHHHHDSSSSTGQAQQQQQQQQPQVVQMQYGENTGAPAQMTQTEMMARMLNLQQAGGTAPPPAGA